MKEYKLFDGGDPQKEIHYFDVVPDFSREELLEKLRDPSRSEIIITYATKKDAFRIYLSFHSHSRIKEETGEEFDFGGRVIINRETGEMAFSPFAGNTSDTPKQEKPLVASIITRFLEREYGVKDSYFQAKDRRSTKVFKKS